MRLSNNAFSARTIATEIGAGRMSAEEMLAEHGKAIAGREEAVRAFSYLAETQEIGSGPLRGVSIGVKDIYDTRDMPTRYGSSIYKDHHPVSDASLVAMLRSAGATIVGKTETTEFAWFNPARTRNPHNLNHTPGGSSSGSAAGVAAGFFSAAIGSQTGGSIIRPAAFCGVAGYKPSFRLFPTIGMKCFSWSLDTAGFFAASVADTAFVAAACSGRQLEIDDHKTTAPRIGIYRSTIDNMIDPDMEKAARAAATKARDAGAIVVEVIETSLLHDARLVHGTIQDFEAHLALADELKHNPDLLSSKLRAHLTESGNISPEDYDDARRTANRARKSCRDLFGNCDILLLPSAPGTAPETLESTGDSIFNRLWTLMGMPAANVAGMTGDNGLPLGLQILGQFGDDANVLQSAHWLEQVLRS